MRLSLNQILTVPTADPEDARRRKLLNILSVGIAVLTFLTLLFALGLWIFTDIEEAGTPLLFLALAITLVGIGVIYLINRFWSGTVASSLFLVLLIIVMALSDVPQEVAAGRTLFLFTIPVIMASVLLRPWVSFIAAVAVGVLVAMIGSQAGILYNPAVTFGFLAVALVSWLSGRSLEDALASLHAINQQLDGLVSERTRELYDALRQVSAESSKNQAILEGIADGVIVFDEQGKGFAANPAIAHLINRPMEQIVGSTVESLMSEEVNANDQERIVRLLHDHNRGRENIKAPWGQKVMSISFATVQGSAKEPIGAVMVLRDFTSEAELDRMKNAFLSMASHELRTPLNAIVGYSDRMRTGTLGPVNSEQEMGLDRILSNSQRMLNLVNNLLDQAQIEAGKLQVTIYPFEVSPLVEDVVATMQILAGQKGIALQHSIAPEVPEKISSDQHRLHQVLMNLTGNAIKFTEEGQVAVRVYCPDKQHWAIDVEDTGPGIPEEAQAYIFETFRQVNDPTTRKHQGSGLGLSIVKQIITLLGGEVRVKSKEGEGSTFTVILPILSSAKETT